jgi:hypothetical protein
MRTLYIFNGARHFNPVEVWGSLTAVYCTHLGPLPRGAASVPILYEFYDASGTLRGSAPDAVSGPNQTSIGCTGFGFISSKMKLCTYGMGMADEAWVGNGFIRVAVPSNSASRILCTAELVSGTEGGSANIVDRLIGVRKGAFVFPPDTFLP